MKKIRIFLFIAVLIAAIVVGGFIAVTLDQRVDLQSIGYADLPLAVVVLGVLSVGVMATLLLCYLPMWLHLKGQLRRTEKDLQKARKESDQLRHLAQEDA